MAVVVSHVPEHRRMVDNHDALEHRNRRLMFHHPHHHQQNMAKYLPTSSLPLSPECAPGLRSGLAYLWNEATNPPVRAQGETNCQS
jgi:hypothetical protein